MSLFSKDVGIDLGTANTLVYMKGKGIIMREPSVVAVDTKSDEVRCVGAEAKAVIGRTPGSIVAVRPLKDGVIADFDITANMLETFLKKACGNSRIKDTVLKEKFISAYNEFIERRPQGDSMVALQEVLEDLRQQEQELAELADLPLQKVNLLTQAMRGVESIDAPIGDEEDATKLDFVRGNERDDPGVAFQDRSMIDCIQKSLNELNPREAQVLRLRYGIGTNQDHTLEEVGRTLGLTRERVRQIESAAIRKLRTPDFTERLRDYLQS